MAQALFINRTDLIRNSNMDGNIDTDKILPFIKLSQELEIKNITGSALYDKISSLITSGDIDLVANAKYKTLLNDYIVPALIWYAQAAFYPFHYIQIRNGGVFKHSSETAETVSKDELDYIVKKARDNGEYYGRRFVDFMSFNQSDYPEYTSNTNDQINPSQDQTFNGWVL
tara:strand:+ start:16310 stop:16822 length:513 start_codon:yes stop_codon:yes gene_type:complete